MTARATDPNYYGCPLHGVHHDAFAADHRWHGSICMHPECLGQNIVHLLGEKHAPEYHRLTKEYGRSSIHSYLWRRMQQRANDPKADAPWHRKWVLWRLRNFYAAQHDWHDRHCEYTDAYDILCDPHGTLIETRTPERDCIAQDIIDYVERESSPLAVRYWMQTIDSADLSRLIAAGRRKTFDWLALHRDHLRMVLPHAMA